MAQQDGPPENINLQAFSGLKNTVTPERLAPQELARAQNIDLDDLGQPHRRRGYTLRDAGDYHSLRQSSHDLYAVKNGDLGVVEANYQFTTVYAGVGAAPLAYEQVGDTLYFSSQQASGKVDVRSRAASGWGASTSEGMWLSPVVNPTATLGEIRGKLLGKPPMASYLAYLNGRIYLANENLLWATELYLYDYVDKTRNFLQFESKITGVANGTDGLYVGTETNVWYLEGQFSQMRRKLIMNVGMVPGSLIGVPAEFISAAGDMAQQSRNASLFLTEHGLIAGFDGGVCTNITQARHIFPSGQHVAPLFRKQDGANTYVGVIDSGGTPAANTRIGDYVDAEIRRFQGA